MDTYTAETIFCDKTGVTPHSIRAREALEMLQKEALYEESRLRKANPRKRGLYSQAVEIVCERLIMWFNNAHEWDTSDLVTFVASHRHACVWAILAGQEQQKRKDAV